MTTVPTLLSFMKANPSATIRVAAKATGYSKSYVAESLAQFRRAGLIPPGRLGRPTRTEELARAVNQAAREKREAAEREANEARAAQWRDAEAAMAADAELEKQLAERARVEAEQKEAVRKEVDPMIWKLNEAIVGLRRLKEAVDGNAAMYSDLSLRIARATKALGGEDQL